MKIAQLANNFRRTFPKSKNAIYSHVANLTDGLVRRNNDVTLFATGDSETTGKLISVTPQATADMTKSEGLRRNLAHLLVSRCYQMAEDFDIIHSHFSLNSSFYAPLVGVPTVQSLHIPINEESRPLLDFFKDNNYVSFSLAQRKQLPELNWVANIYHGLDLLEFEFNPHPKDHLLYLGRVTAEKGTHLAIEAAKAAGVPIIIAGRSYPDENYWHEFIEKQIDGKMVTYVGEADYESKKELLKNAKAMLFPTQVEETFGLAMIEALASGTPIIGWDNGSVAEVVQDKETGYVVSSTKDMIKAIGAIDKISREACRQRAINLFSIEKMVTGYEKVYLRVIEERRKKQSTK